MDSMRGMLPRAQGAGSSSRGIRDGASEGSGPSVLLRNPPHVEGRARVSTRVRGTAIDGGGDGDGFPFPPSVEPATRGRERVSPRVPGHLALKVIQARWASSRSPTLGLVTLSVCVGIIFTEGLIDSSRLRKLSSGPCPMAFLSMSLW